MTTDDYIKMNVTNLYELISKKDIKMESTDKIEAESGNLISIKTGEDLVMSSKNSLEKVINTKTEKMNILNGVYSTERSEKLGDYTVKATGIINMKGKKVSIK